MISPSKHCSLDQISTWLVKDWPSTDLAPFLTTLFNKSIASFDVPLTLKKAFITPLLKKQNLNVDELSNYRPVSNLSFILKQLEKVIAVWLVTYLNANNLLAKKQSAYRRFHSTETLLLRLMSDLVSAVELGTLALMSLRDMSAAFDTVDHAIILQKLNCTYIIRGDALNWITSYLVLLKIDGSTSAETLLSHGVPQGSVFHAILFILYTCIRAHGLLPYSYADGNQIVFYCKPSEADNLKSAVVNCITNITAWLSSHSLKISRIKTEFIWSATSRRNHLIDHTTICISGTQITPSPNVKLLGVHIDEELSQSVQISRTVSSGFFHLWQIKAIRRCLSSDAATSLVNAFVALRLDYCNSIYAGLPNSETNHLQTVYNAAATLIFSASRYSHITPLLRDRLHWLWCTKRILYKLCMTVFKARHGMAPEYLTELCTPVAVSEKRATLRSASTSHGLVNIPRRTPNTNFCDCAFRVAGPAAWNSLSTNIRTTLTIESFKRQLKTHLFTISYS